MLYEAQRTKKNYQKLNTSAHSSTKYNFSKRGGRGTNFPPKSWQTEECKENELHRQTPVFQGLYNISTVSTCISLFSLLIFFLILTVRALIRLLKMCRPKKMGGGGGCMGVISPPFQGYYVAEVKPSIC